MSFDLSQLVLYVSIGVTYSNSLCPVCPSESRHIPPQKKLRPLALAWTHCSCFLAHYQNQSNSKQDQDTRHTYAKSRWSMWIEGPCSNWNRVISPEWIFKTPFLIRIWRFSSSLALRESISWSILFISMLYSLSSAKLLSRTGSSLIRASLLFADIISLSEGCPPKVDWCEFGSLFWVEISSVQIWPGLLLVVSVERARGDSTALSDWRGFWLSYFLSSNRFSIKPRFSWSKFGILLLLVELINRWLYK